MDETQVLDSNLPSTVAVDHKHHHHAHNASGLLPSKDKVGGKVLTIRSHAGLSGDMLVMGLARMLELEQAELELILKSLHPKLSSHVHLSTRSVGGIMGSYLEVDLPSEHAHRTPSDLQKIINQSSLSEQAKELAAKTIELLAKVEGEVHGRMPSEVHFHEVGALDSILDIALACEFFVRLALNSLIVSPLPLGDGAVDCAHGSLPVPAPAVLKLLEGLVVKPFLGEGETVTPTAAALLHTLGAKFGPWPQMAVLKTALVYGSRDFPKVPNGATFALGHAEEGEVGQHRG